MADSLVFPSNMTSGGIHTNISLREYSRPKPGSPVQTNLGAVIILPLPVALQDSFNIDVANPAFDLLGNDFSQILNSGKTSTEQIVNEIKNNNFSVSKAMETALKAGSLTPGISDTGLGRLGQANFGVVRNPHVTTIFEGVKLKTYQFTWRLSPQSEADAKRLNSIISTLKMLMHPKKAIGGFALEYPYLATVKFQGLEKSIVPNVKDSFITGLQINGAASGALAFYRDGQPLSIDLTLSFQEINIQTREDFGATGTTGVEGVGITSGVSTVSSSGNFGSSEMQDEFAAYRQN
jgi:hypothetical protein